MPNPRFSGRWWLLPHHCVVMIFCHFCSITFKEEEKWVESARDGARFSTTPRLQPTPFHPSTHNPPLSWKVTMDWLEVRPLVRPLKGALSPLSCNPGAIVQLTPAGVPLVSHSILRMSFPPETFLNSGVSLTFLTPVWPTNRRTSCHLEYLPVRLSDWPSSHRAVWVDRFKIAEEAPAALGLTLSFSFHGTSSGDTDFLLFVFWFQNLLLVSPPYLGLNFFWYIYYYTASYIFIYFVFYFFYSFLPIVWSVQDPEVVGKRSDYD